MTPGSISARAMAHGLASLVAVLLVRSAVAAEPGSTLPASAAVETRSIKGLDQPAEILIDQWGVAHIFAESQRDAFFLQGYNAARDRLWQIDLWRKRGLGRLSASFGPAFVEQDRAARLFLYRGDMAREWASYSSDAHAIMRAFTEGVNAYVREVRSGLRPVPVEFQITGSAPEEWAPHDVLRIRSHTLASNAASEVARARVACAGGLSADRLRRKLEPPRETGIPDGLDPCDIPPDVLKVYGLATQPVNFEALAGLALEQLAGAPAPASLPEAGVNEGSNNWVVAPSRSATGRAQMANDPHRSLGVPSLRYVVGLHAPGLALVGAGEPALPGISLGHNGAIAFGLTIFAIDQEDLYVYELNPDDPTRYRYRSRWEAMRTVRETIEVKGEAPRQVVLRFTRHGPVLAAQPDRRRAFALRTVWSEPGSAGYFGSSRLFTARTWKDFRAANRSWGAPPLNLVYADAAGNIGWAPSGLAPVRKNWDGLLPVPGDGRYEWSGFLKSDALPSVLNPTSGYIATANEMNLPDGFPHGRRRIAFEWANRSRSTRIRQVLDADPQITLAESAALQADIVNVAATRAIGLLTGLSSPDPGVARALEILKAWDGMESAESVAATIHQVWVTRHLGRLTVTRVAPAPARPLIGNGNPDAVLSYLEAPDAALGENPAAARSDLVLTSLRDALDDLSARLGPDMAGWTWGRLHTVRFEPAVGLLAEPSLRRQMTVGPIPLPGSSETPRALSFNASTFEVTAGASVRMVIDAGHWDESTFINAPGQSGDPFSPFYRNLFELWAEGRQVPLRFSREAIIRDASRAIMLTPAP